MKLTYTDSTHAYYLDGTRCKSVTTIAKIPDDTYNLEQWSMRQVAIGLAMKPALVEAVAAHYDDRKKLGELCEQAKAVAGADDASRRGTAAHRITELVDEGRHVIQTELSMEIAAGWRSALDLAGFDFVPEWSERIVVWPEQKVCGRFDRFMRRRCDGRLVVVDLKTGPSVLRYPHSIAVQLAAYANAPLVAGPLPPDGGSTEVFEPMPSDLDLEVGYVINLTPEGSTVAEIDIAAGAQVLTEVIWPTLKWRKRTDLVMAVLTGAPAAAADPLVAQLEASVADAQAKKRAWLEGRIEAVRSTPEAIEALRAAWPRGVPTFKQSDAHTLADLVLIEPAVNAAERAVAAPFPPEDPSEAEPERRVVFPPKKVEPAEPLPVAATVDEGDERDELLADILIMRTKILSDIVLRDLVPVWAKDANATGVSIAMNVGTSRRHAIGRIILAVGELGEDIVRAYTAHVLGTDAALFPSVPFGQILGALHASEAKAIAGMCLSAQAITYRDDGVAVVAA